jgi:hypothetical protein
VFNSRIRRFSFAVAAAALFMVAGCSNQATDQATNQAPAPAKKAAAAKAAAAKPATSKPAAAKPAAAKPAVKPANTGKIVAAKGTTAKPVTVSSKVTQPAAPAATLVTVPKGTMISAKIDQALASNKNHAGDTFAAVLYSSIKVGGKTVIPKGTHITGRVVTANKKSPELTVALASVDLNGKSYKLVSDPISPSGKSPAKTDATDNDAAKAKETKDITVAAEHHLKFKLAKAVKLPVKS